MNASEKLKLVGALTNETSINVIVFLVELNVIVVLDRKL